MKKFMRYCSVALCLGAALLFGSTCFAQTTFPFLAAGSSGAFNATAIGGAIGATPAICTNTPNNSNLALATNVYIFSQTGKSGHQYFQALDARGTLDAQNALGWIEWSGSADGTTLNSVCLYLSVDSIVGQRLYFATNSGGMPAASINFPGGCSYSTPIPGDNQVPLFPPDTGLPATVCAALQGKAFNAAPTDIRAEDAAFGTARACGAYSATGTGFGYSCTLPTPTEIHSGVGGSTKQVQAVNYAIAGTDPLTGGIVAHTAAGSDGHPFVSLSAGGQAVLVLVNTHDTSSDGFGTTGTFNNINRPDLAHVYVGGATRTREVIGGSGLGSKGMTVLVREPLSGTFNVFEFQVPRVKEFFNTQEDLTNSAGVISANGIGMATPSGWVWEGGSVSGSVTGNPLDWKKTSTGGLKVRVIGTGEMVATLASNSSTDAAGNSLTNQIGYAFFSFGNVKPALGLAKYLTVDGVDPLFDGPDGTTDNPGGTGTLPSCSAPCSTAVTLTNIKNGSYPIWNILRVITSGQLGATNSSGACLSGATVCQMVAAMEASYSLIPDLVPISQMQMFRSHQTITVDGKAFAQHNGNKHYTGIAGTSCGFAPVTGAAIQYECGGDVAGARFQIQTDLDQITDTAAELVGLQQ